MIILTFPGRLSQEARERIRDAFQSVAPDGEKILVLEDGATATSDNPNALTFGGIIT